MTEVLVEVCRGCGARRVGVGSPAECPSCSLSVHDCIDLLTKDALRSLCRQLVAASPPIYLRALLLALYESGPLWEHLNERTVHLEQWSRAHVASSLGPRERQYWLANHGWMPKEDDLVRVGGDGGWERCRCGILLGPEWMYDRCVVCMRPE